MKKIKCRKIFALYMVLMLCINILPLKVYATNSSSNQCGDSLVWDYDYSSGVLTISGEGEMYDYDRGTNKAPWSKHMTSVIIEEGVTSIGEFAFYNCAYLERVVLPDSLNEIGLGAFWECDKLQSIDFPQHMKKLGSYAFYKCVMLENAILPDGLSLIGMNTFAGCKTLKYVMLPDEIKTIDQGAFAGCSMLCEIILPYDLQEIGYGAFGDCTNLSKIVFKGDAPRKIYKSDLGDLPVAAYYPQDNVTWTESVIATYGIDVLWLREGSEKNNCCGENVKWKLSEDGVLTISGEGDMYDYSIENAMPWAGSLNLIKSIAIEDGVTGVGNYAFYNSSILEEVTLPETIKEIRDYAFSSCDEIKDINLPNNIECIGNNVFSDCNMLEEVTLPETLKEIRDYTFSNCDKIKDINLPNNIERIGNNVFSDCSMLENVVLPNKLSNVGNSVFANCISLKAIIVPESVKILGDDVFKGCSNLRKLVFKGDAPDIGVGNSGCDSNFRVIYYPPNNETWTKDVKFQWDMNAYWVQETDGFCGENVKWKLSEDGVLTISGEGDMYDYQCNYDDSYFSNGISYRRFCAINAMPWAEYKDIISSVVIEDGVTSIGTDAFYNCGSIKNINMPNTIENIKEDAFYNCFMLDNINIPNSVKHLGNAVFANCKSLKTIILPDSITCIPEAAFIGCSTLINVTMSNNTTRVEREAFSSCESLQCVVFPKGVEYVGASVFSSCNKLKRVVFEGDAPKMPTGSCTGKSFVAYYPKDNETWSDLSVRKLPNVQLWIEGLPIVEKETRSLTLNGDIGLNVYISPQEEYLINGGRMWIEGKDKIYEAQGKEIDGRLKFTAHIAAAEMTKNVWFEYDGVRKATKEEVKSCDYKYSVKEYAETVFASNSENATVKLKNLIASMLNYGAYAQEYFGINTETLANEDVENWGYSKKVDSSIVDNVEGEIIPNMEGKNIATFTTNSLILDSYTKLRFFCTLDKNVDASQIYMAYRLENSGESFSFVPLETRSGKYYGTIENVAAAHLSDNYEAFICEKEGEEYTQISDMKIYSVECYANTVLKNSEDEKLKQTVTSLISYGKTAKEYFNEVK